MNIFPSDLPEIRGNPIHPKKYMDALRVRLLEDEEYLDLKSCFGNTSTHEDTTDDEIATCNLSNQTALA